jgi:hypothetical protein
VWVLGLDLLFDVDSIDLQNYLYINNNWHVNDPKVKSYQMQFLAVLGFLYGWLVACELSCCSVRHLILFCWDKYRFY